MTRDEPRSYVITAAQDSLAVRNTYALTPAELVRFNAIFSKGRLRLDEARRLAATDDGNVDPVLTGPRSSRV